NMSNNSLRIFGPTASGTSGEVMVLSIENFSGTGTFTGFPNAVGGYSLNMGSPSPQTWDSSTGSCTITISSFNPTDSLITGTFSFVARPSSTFIVPGNTATGTKTITNGTFTNVKIQ
ncbi:MAG TPA: hypothetical protein VK927_00860, partial [Adhaeribacter sp.]|nr:hypothetical protein [Adhaeribacter sp.]